MTTTTDFFEALQQLPDYRAAKIVADYIEEGKQLNLERMKEIFMTKDDKGELIMMMKDDKDELIMMMKDDKDELIMMMKDDKIELMRDIQEVRKEAQEIKADLIKEIGKAKFSMIIWYIIIGTSQTATILGFLYFMLKVTHS